MAPRGTRTGPPCPLGCLGRRGSIHPVTRLTDRFSRALGFAIVAHGDQVRKGTRVPYVSHLLQVAGIALEHGADEDEAIAALLHDTIEDTKVDRAMVEAWFGERVADIVEAVSDSTGHPKPPWRERKEHSIAHVRRATPSAALVSGADKLHNARSLYMEYVAEGETLWDRFRASRDETLWYYRQLIDALDGRTSAVLVAELRRVVEALHARAGIPMTP